MTSTDPIIPTPLQNSNGQGSQGRQSDSRRSSVSGISANTIESTPEDNSEQTKPSTRGRKPFEISPEVDRGLVRILNSTDVSFDKLAQAVQDSGGPRKLWLRKRFERITETKCFGLIRLRHHKEGAQERRERQQRAIDLSLTASSTDLEQQEHTAEEGTEITSPVAQRRRNVERANSTHDQPSANRKRRSGIISLRTAIGGAEHDDSRRSYPRNLTGLPRTITRSSTTPSSAKRPFVDDEDDEIRNDYGARKDRTRALSLSAVTQRLETSTGLTGLYDHIKRVSVKSHISPQFRTFRFSRGSRRASDGSTAPRSSVYDPNGNEIVPIAHVPDPDYENSYHAPTAERIAELQLGGALAVATLMMAKVTSMSDKDAESSLLEAIPGEMGALINHINTADDKGITPLHLAVAYGYTGVCRYLMQKGANPAAVTNRGSSVCRFARAAQDFANETSLYYRILHCRQWICAGFPPPTEKDARNASNSEDSRNTRPTAKRVKTNDRESTLFTVEETPVDEETAPNVANQFPPRASTMMHRDTGLTPLVTDCGFGVGQPVERSASNYDPSPMSMRHCLRDHGSIGNLLTPTSFSSPNGTLWPAGSMGPPPTSIQPSPQTAESTGQQYDLFGGLNIMTNFNHGLPPSASFAEPIVRSTSSLIPESTTAFEWPTEYAHYSEQMLMDQPYLTNVPYMPPNIQNDQNQRYSYQEQYERPVTSRPHYPTPPSDPRPRRQQESWQPGWDVSNATALALSENAPFPNMFWVDDDRVAPTRNNTFFPPDPSYPYDPNV